MRSRHAHEADTTHSTCRCRGRVEHNWLARHRRPRVRVAVVLIETNDGVVEVWSDDDCYSADPDALRGDAERHAGPCRLRHDVRLDDHDALSVLEDFLEGPRRRRPGIVHWEETGIYIPSRDGDVTARVGLVLTLDDANWRLAQPNLGTRSEAGSDRT